MWYRNIFHPKSGYLAESATQSDGWRDLSLSSRSLRQLNGMQLSASRFLQGKTAGLRNSLRRKPASEFREHRMYVPGDDVRHVDWKASARSEHIFIKQGEHPKEALVYLLLDCSSSMAWGQPPKLRASLSLAAALGFLSLSNYDRLMVIPLGRPDLQPLGFISGKGQYPLFLNYLRSLTFIGKVDLQDAIYQFTRHHSTKGGLILLLSDLLEVPRLTHILQLLPMPTWDVIIFHLLHAEELKPSIKGDFELIDIESRKRANYDINSEAVEMYGTRLKAWRDHLEIDCVNANAFYNMLQTDWSLEQEIIPHLRALNIIRNA
jgi:uncharacterized protein (DUF58 family)